MIEIFNLLKNSNKLNGIDINELTDLFVKGNSAVYDIGMIGKGKVILKNKEDNKFERLDCICTYFDTNGITDCNDIKSQIICESCPSCRECYKHALEKLEKGELSLK